MFAWLGLTAHRPLGSIMRARKAAYAMGAQFKVWEELTIPSYAKHARYGAKAGQPNPQFLDAKLFLDLVLRPHREAQFEPHTGPFLFEFQRHGMSSEEFCSRLDTFFGQLPKDFNYAVEIETLGWSALNIAMSWSVMG